MPFGFFLSRFPKMGSTDRQEIDVEDVLSKLNLDEKISLLSGKPNGRVWLFEQAR